MKRFGRLVAGCLLAIPACGLGGCTAKTLAFATATKFGLDISQQADQTVDVSMGYDRAEVACIPANNSDAGKDADTYSVLGFFRIKYGNPWTLQPVTLNQVFATGWAARQAAKNPQLQAFFGKTAGQIAKETAQ